MNEKKEYYKGSLLDFDDEIQKQNQEYFNNYGYHFYSTNRIKESASIKDLKTKHSQKSKVK